ncbi:hypothetical protein BDW62DRAFT_201427 [Aspergillus aurantiobrunneus]
MCGIPRPSTGHRIAIMFPSASPSPSPSSSPSSSPACSPEPPSKESYTLSFQDSDSDSLTKAILRSKDTTTLDAFRTQCSQIDLRIERHGDLTLKTETQPLHHFQLHPPETANTDEMEFSLPQRLDLNVSDRGIVGRQVTVTARGEGGVVSVGSGIVGFD